MKNSAQTLVGVIAVLLLFRCSGRPQHFKEVDGKWVLTDLRYESAELSFKPLNSSWEPHPPPTDNCAIFYGKRNVGAHIGVFLHPIKPGIEPEEIFNYMPKELLLYYMSSDEVNNRNVIVKLFMHKVPEVEYQTLKIKKQNDI